MQGSDTRYIVPLEMFVNTLFLIADLHFLVIFKKITGTKISMIYQ